MKEKKSSIIKRMNNARRIIRMDLKKIKKLTNVHKIVLSGKEKKIVDSLIIFILIKC